MADSIRRPRTGIDLIKDHDDRIRRLEHRREHPGSGGAGQQTFVVAGTDIRVDGTGPADDPYVVSGTLALPPGLVPARDRFTVTDPTGDYILAYAPVTDSEHVYLRRLYQYIEDDYTLLDQTVTLLAGAEALADDILEVKYLRLEGAVAGASVTPPVPLTALFVDPYETAPSTSGAHPYDLAEGTYFGGFGRHGTGIGWQSDCHAHKTVSAHPTLAAGIAIRNVGSVPGYSWTADTDGNDFGLLSFCGDAGAVCHVYLDWDGVNRLRVWRGQRGTVLATATVATPNDTVGQWLYVEAQVTVADSGGRIQVWQDDALLIDFTGDTRNGGTSTDLDTIKMGGFYPTNLDTDDFYIAITRLGDPGDVTYVTVVP